MLETNINTVLNRGIRDNPWINGSCTLIKDEEKIPEKVTTEYQKTCRSQPGDDEREGHSKGAEINCTERQKSFKNIW